MPGPKRALTSGNVISPRRRWAGLPARFAASTLGHKPGARPDVLHSSRPCQPTPRTGRAARFVRGEAEEAMSEAHVPTQHSPPCEEPRVPSSHVDPRRSRHSRRPSAQGPHPTQRLTRRVWRLRNRRQLEQLKRARRAVCGPVSVRFAPGPSTTPPEVGYAVGRAVGTAVARNRLRRRLRAAVTELSSEMAPGAYMIAASGGATTFTFSQLRGVLRDALERAGAVRASE